MYAESEILGPGPEFLLCDLDKSFSVFVLTFLRYKMKLLY